MMAAVLNSNHRLEQLAQSNAAFVPQKTANQRVLPDVNVVGERRERLLP